MSGRMMSGGPSPRFLLFAASRYWTDPEALKETVGKIGRELNGISSEITLILDGDLSVLPESMDSAVIVPMSGAVQRAVLEAGRRCGRAVLYAGYCAGNFDAESTGRMLTNNAAPTLMDTWAVLRRTHDKAFLAVTRAQLEDILLAGRACDRMKGAKLILIGETEPWVISNASSLNIYRERLGIEIERVDPEEVIARYEAATPDDARDLIGYFRRSACGFFGAAEKNLTDACRFAAALVQTMEAHEAQGGAIACFHLIARTGTNACLGVSFLNDMTGRFMACEGDLDSAVTMLLMRGLTDKGLWMANPALDASGHVNFSHCTAPWHIAGGECPYRMKPHHETGVGVSLDVEFPEDALLTLCRISDDCRAMTVHTARIVPGDRKPVCHTQIWADIDGYEHYLNTALGCHQVFAFEDIAGRLKIAARMLGLELL